MIKTLSTRFRRLLQQLRSLSILLRNFSVRTIFSYRSLSVDKARQLVDVYTNILLNSLIDDGRV